MELYKEILTHLLTREELQITLPDVMKTAAGAVESECYKTLQKIKTVIENDGLSDEECFAKIEELVCLFEDLGIGTGNRHDFG